VTVAGTGTLAAKVFLSLAALLDLTAAELAAGAFDLIVAELTAGAFDLIAAELDMVVEVVDAKAACDAVK
jgi:hypothetical protein